MPHTRPVRRRRWPSCVAARALASALALAALPAIAAPEPGCAPPAERASVRAKKEGASVVLSVRDGGWRPLARLAKRPVGPVRAADGSHVAWVDRDFRPDGVLVIRRLDDGAEFRAELSAVPRALCFSADGAAVLLESADGVRTPVPVASVPAG